MDNAEPKAMFGTRHKTKTNKAKDTTQKTKKNTSNTDFSKTPGVNPDALEGYAVFWGEGYNTLYKASKMKLIQDLNYYIYTIASNMRIVSVRLLFKVKW